MNLETAESILSYYRINRNTEFSTITDRREQIERILQDISSTTTLVERYQSQLEALLFLEDQILTALMPSETAQQFFEPTDDENRDTINAIVLKNRKGRCNKENHNPPPFTPEEQQKIDEFYAKNGTPSTLLEKYILHNKNFEDHGTVSQAQMEKDVYLWEYSISQGFPIE